MGAGEPVRGAVSRPPACPGDILRRNELARIATDFLTGDAAAGFMAMQMGNMLVQAFLHFGGDRLLFAQAEHPAWLISTDPLIQSIASHSAVMSSRGSLNELRLEGQELSAAPGPPL